MVSGLLITAVFLVFAFLMMTRRMPALLALPLMASVIGVISGLLYGCSMHDLKVFLFQKILTEGSCRLVNAMMYTIFGSILSQVVIRSGIASRLIGLTAEYAGRHKIRLALLLTVMTAVCFSSVTGLGAVIMIGTLVMPILIGAGLSAPFASGLMLFAIAVGGVFCPVNMGFYTSVLNVPQETVKHYVLYYGMFLSAAALCYLIVGGYKERSTFNWAETAEIPGKKVPAASLITPVIPIFLIMLLDWDIIPSFIAAIFWGILTAAPKKAVSELSASALEGIKEVAPVIGLFMGIGMCLNSMDSEPVKAVMAPILSRVPASPIGFILFFTLLAPLALYRGPFNMYGLGAGIAGILLSGSILPPAAIMAAFFSVGQMQGVCDPTNTHNVWLAQFSKTSTENMLKSTILYVWGFVAAALCWAVFAAGALNSVQ